jgi:citrate/tricarballylate utilization protein
MGLLIGPAGQFILKVRRDPAITDPRQSYTDNTLLFLLFSISLTGMLLLAYRETAAMRWLLAIHLSVVLALFVLMPYGKFVHGFHRLAALARSAREARSR